MDALTLMMMRRAMGGSQQPDPDTMMASNGAGPESLPPSPSPGMPPGAMASGTGPMMQPSQPPALSRMPPPPSAVMQPPAREPGHIKKMFMDFMYGGTQALKKMQGLPTDDELRQQDLEFALKQREGQMREQLMTAQIQNYAIDNKQKQQESEFRQQEQRAKDLREQNDPKNWTPEDRATYGQRIGLSGNALTKFRATGEFPSDFGTQDKSLSDQELAIRAANGDKAAQKALDLLAQKARAGRSVTNIGTGSTETDYSQPLKNRDEEVAAQNVANRGVSIEQAMSGAPIKSGGKLRILNRSAALGDARKPLNPAQQKAMGAAERGMQIGNLIAEDAAKHPNWVGGLASVGSGGGEGGIIGTIKSKTGMGLEQGQAQFRNRVNREFTEVAHELFGSAFTGTEREQALASLPNIGMSPPDFKAAMDVSLQNFARAKEIINAQRGGLGGAPMDDKPAAAPSGGAKGWDDILGKKKR